MYNSRNFAQTNTEVIIVMKNKITSWLQNRTVLAALLVLLVAGTAIAGVMAMRKGSLSEEETPEMEYAMETQEKQAEEDYQSLEKETVEENLQVPVQSNEIQALTPSEGTTKKTEGSGTNSEKKQDANKQDTSLEALAEGTEELPASAEAAGLLFLEDSTMIWPVEGEIILDYSMDTTTYFSTLKQYKCNPGILIQAQTGTQVLAAAPGYVNIIGYDEEIGNYIGMDLGGEYTVIYGQLEDIQVSLNQVVETGETLGVVAAPTKYYVVEGPNLYLELRYQGTPVDPMDYIR